jgi:osmotically-inducible protein OsmY
MNTYSDQVSAVRLAWQADPDIGVLADHLHLMPHDADADLDWRVVGDVPSIAARRKATRIARETLANAAIEDAVRLEPAIRESDRALADEVRKTLRAEPLLDKVRIIDSGERPPTADQPWIGVIASSGIIHLGGWVPELSIAALAEGIAWETAACRDVRNLISYQPLHEDRDQAIADAATMLMREHPTLGDQPIKVGVERGSATLTGTVADADKLRLAEALCWFAPNVREVHNNLEIAGELT